MTPRHDSGVAEPKAGHVEDDQLVDEAVTTTAEESIDAASGLLGRISVRAPYFALSDVQEVDGGAISTTVPPAPPLNPETGVAEAAQVARHLAILGSLAVAAKRDDDDRHHYLATRAHFLRTANNYDGAEDQGRAGGSLRAEAVGQWTDRRNARAFAKLLSADGQTLNVLDVEYTVMTPRMFDRLQPPIHESVLALSERTATPEVMPALDALPFVVLPIPHDDPSRVVVDCGEIPVGMCAGHFDDYPAAPVALVMGQLSRAAGLSLERQLDCGPITYQVDEAKVKAARLGRAGQRLTLRTRYRRRSGQGRGYGHVITGVAEADGEVIGEMEITLSVSSLPAPFPFPVGGF